MKLAIFSLRESLNSGVRGIFAVRGFGIQIFPTGHMHVSPLSLPVKGHAQLLFCFVYCAPDTFGCQLWVKLKESKTNMVMIV